MNFIIPVDFIDVSRMAAALVLKHAVHFADDKRRQSTPGTPHHDTETILLRGPLGEITTENWFQDVPHADTDLLKSWPSAQQVLGKIAESHVRRAGHEPILGKAMVVSLKAGGHVDWHVDQGAYAEAHDRFHVCLVPSSGAMTYCGGLGASLPVGQLTWINNRALHSAINVGSNPRINLIVDVRKPETVN
jgi:hypothetical protein